MISYKFNNLSLLLDTISALNVGMKLRGGDFKIPLVSCSPPNCHTRMSLAFENIMACLLEMTTFLTSSSDHIIVYADFAFSAVHPFDNNAFFINLNRSVDRIFLFSRMLLLNLSSEKVFLTISLNGRPMTLKNAIRDLGLLYLNTLNFCDSSLTKL